MKKIENMKKMKEREIERENEKAEVNEKHEDEGDHAHPHTPRTGGNRYPTTSNKENKHLISIFRL